jgi:L-alanine-DL-glutamate epimerase-like enolase superfamily enzyme
MPRHSLEDGQRVVRAATATLHATERFAGAEQMRELLRTQLLALMQVRWQGLVQRWTDSQMHQ